MRRAILIIALSAMVMAAVLSPAAFSENAMPVVHDAEVSGTSNLTFNDTVYAYTVYIATATYETPAYTAVNVVNVSFSTSSIAWVLLGPGNLLTIDPPPYLTYSTLTGNYGTFNATMQISGIAGNTGTAMQSTAYADITVVSFPQNVTANGTGTTTPSFLHLSGIDILVIGILIASFVIALVLMAVTADRKARRIKEDKYEKKWIKND